MASDDAAGVRGPFFTTSLIAGALSGLSVDLLFFPLDTLKTRLQASQGFLAAGGFSGVYRGLGSVAVGSAPGAAAFFVTYESLKPALARWGGEDVFSDKGALGPPALHMMAASAGEVIACLIRVPTEVIKSRQQTSAYGNNVSSAAAFQAVLRESGVRGLYRGYAGTVGREIPFTCIQFPLYEALKRRIAISPSFGHEPLSSKRLDDKSSELELRKRVRNLPTWQAGLAGSVAGAFAACITTPLDVVKTRIMLERRTFASSPAAAYATPSSAHALPAGVNTRMIPTLLHVLRTEGPMALFAGFVPRTLWIGFGGAVFLGTFDAGVKILESGPAAAAAGLVPTTSVRTEP